MRKLIPIVAFLFAVAAAPADAHFVVYKEQFYRLFHVHHNRNPDNIMENIYWLERALHAPFANPLFALARVADETEWQKYRYLFMMHVNIKLTEQHLFLGNLWNKRNAFFFNAPFRDMILSSLETAEACFLAALYHWNQALVWAEKLNDNRFRWINLESVQFWEDQAHRIRNGRLNYARTINRELALLQQVRERFQAMDEHTY
ncbi:MAG: hypothetical protein FWC65_05570 [Treponema sp.]|nr:hypothetical protein [Treponema sp.]